MKSYQITWGKHNLKMEKKRTLIMGILNITPDSFSDGGKFFETQSAVEHALKMVKEGADIIDIGGESTRPFADPVSTDEEIQRVVPVIEELAPKISVPISIDTLKAEVAEKAINAGASIINDISALKDPDMAGIAVKYKVPIILMHILGEPRTMQLSPFYDDLLEDIKFFLAGAIENAEKQGISRSKIIIDPGIGFGKTYDHNFSLIKNLSVFESLDVPVLMGPSRKAFIRKTLRETKAEEASFGDIAAGTQAAVAACALNGAHIIRVHDVDLSYTTLKIIDSIRNA
ncbi:dihydropteroate synthase [Candidatus Magnetomoraceae bacterium gMMP-15]